MILSALMGLALAPLSAAPTDQSAADFFLESAEGIKTSLKPADDQPKATVLFFLSAECPMVRVYAPVIANMEREYREQGIRFLGIDSNLQDDAEDVLSRKTKAKIEFPILLDPYQVVADQFGVERSPEIFLLDESYRVIYRGAIDDQYGVGTQRPNPLNTWFLDALSAYLAGEPVPVAQTEAKGCLVGRVSDSSELEITYHEHVAPIVARHCVECHRPGQIGPMELIRYKEVRGWAPMIAEVVDEGRMPPWHANPQYGSFKNARRMTDTEKEILKLWAQNGAKEGDGSLKPPKVVFEDDDWAIGMPDLVVELPEEEVIPATGTVPYRYIEVDPELEDDWWVKAVEIHPTNRSVTHHVLVLVIPPGEDRSNITRGNGFFTNHLAVDVPGAQPMVFPDGCGLKLEAGTKFLFQMHYTPNGEEAFDQTQMAIRFADSEDITHPIKTRAIADLGIDIPAGQKDVTFTKRYSFKRPIQLLALFPHMHARGAAFRIDLERSQGLKTILDVPTYDFNWQHTYMLNAPLALEASDVIRLTATYDNSEDNPLNPDHTARVRWGDQTWEEMLVGYVTYVEGNEPISEE